MYSYTAESSRVYTIEFKNIIEKNGSMAIGEYEKHIPFLMRRVFYIYDVPANTIRGHHAHRESQQILICINGAIDVYWNDGKTDNTVFLSDINIGLYVGNMVYSYQYYKTNSTLLVLSDSLYNKDDYIYNFQEFLLEVENDKSIRH